MLSSIGRAWRTLRFRAWVAVTRARLARHGCRFVVDAAQTPRFYGLPRIELEPVGGPSGSLTLRLGSDVRLGRDLTIDVWTGTDGTIDVGSRVTFQNRVRLQAWGGSIVLGDSVQVRDACEMKSKGALTVGARSLIGRNATLHCDTSITVGACVGLAERVTVADSDHVHDGSATFFMEQPVIADPVVIGDNVFLGTNVTVLRGCRIGAACVGAANAVLTGGDYPPSHLLVGAPAKPLRQLGGKNQPG